MTRPLIFNNQICTIFMLASVLVTHHCSCEARRRREDLGAYVTLSQDMRFFDKLLAGAKEEALYKELKIYEPRYLLRWPSLRDLIVTNEYDDNESLETLELKHAHFIERLRQLATSNIDMEDPREDNLGITHGNNISATKPAPLPNTLLTPNVGANRFPTAFKDHGTKKNIQYMTPCHFKICNMGRKRNARQFFGFLTIE